MTLLSWFSHNWNGLLTYLGVGLTGSIVDEFSNVQLFTAMAQKIYIILLIAIFFVTLLGKIVETIGKIQELWLKYKKNKRDETNQ